MSPDLDFNCKRITSQNQTESIYRTQKKKPNNQKIECAIGISCLQKNRFHPQNLSILFVEL